MVKSCPLDHTQAAVVLYKLPASQGGPGRHKCAGCAYQAGISGDGKSGPTLMCEHGSTAPELVVEGLVESQAGPGRHKCVICAYQVGASKKLTPQLPYRFAEVTAPPVQLLDMDDKITKEELGKSLAELRQRAYQATLAPPVKSLQKQVQQAWQRSRDVKLYALKRAAGHCECCGVAAPFKDRHKMPFLEVHHIQSLANQGKDIPENVAAVTPNCHRRLHHASDCVQQNAALQAAIEKKEKAPAS